MRRRSFQLGWTPPGNSLEGWERDSGIDGSCTTLSGVMEHGERSILICDSRERLEIIVHAKASENDGFGAEGTPGYRMMAQKNVPLVF